MTLGDRTRLKSVSCVCPVGTAAAKVPTCLGLLLQVENALCPQAKGRTEEVVYVEIQLVRNIGPGPWANSCTACAQNWYLSELSLSVPECGDVL